MFKNISIQKIINSIFLFLLFFCIIYSSLLCGSPLNNNTSILNIFLNIIAIFSIIINNLIYSKKIKFNKLDFLVILICFLYLIPIIFNTYCSISETFEYFLRYFSIFSIYIIVKNLNLNKKDFYVILHGIILGSIFVILIGIDDMSTHFFQKLHVFLDSYSSRFSSDIRLDSVFQYSNAFAAFINFSCFLAIGFYLKSNSKFFKGFYGVIINIQIISLILSGSRLNIILFIIILFLFLMFLKNKLKTLELLELFFTIFFGSLFYCSNYLNFINNSQNIYVWISLLLECLFIYISHLFIFKINIELSKISIKKLITLIFLFLIIFIIVLLVLLQIPDNLTLFNTKNSAKSIIIKQINDVKPNTEYLFDFNIDASNSNTNSTDNYQIMIFEINDNLENLEVHRIKFNEYTGIKSYQLTTRESTSIIKIVCQSSIINDNTRLTIHNVYVNDSELIVNYKFLPTNLINRISNILSRGDNSLQERFTFFKDGIKIGFYHPFTGSGANGWKYHFKDVQTSDYYTTEVHSYPLQLFIEVGFSGIILYLLLLFMIFMLAFQNLYKKEKDIMFISCLCSFLIISMHSFIDFDMSFFCILLQFYTIIIIINEIYSNKTKIICIKNKKCIIMFSIITILFILYSFCLNLGTQLSRSLVVSDFSSYSSNFLEKTLKLNPYNKSARLIKLLKNSSSDLTKDFELFFKYEPFYTNLDSLKTSYVIYLLKNLNANNSDLTLSKISNISYSKSFLVETVFKRDCKEILNLIKEKNILYPDTSFDLIYETYSNLLTQN